MRTLQFTHEEIELIKSVLQNNMDLLLKNKSDLSNMIIEKSILSETLSKLSYKYKEVNDLYSLIENGEKDV